MGFLKEDGSLDIERINKLPLEERMHAIAHLTKEEREKYISKLPLNESKNTRPIIYGNLKEELASGKVVNAFDVVKNL